MGVIVWTFDCAPLDWDVVGGYGYLHESDVIQNHLTGGCCQAT